MSPRPSLRGWDAYLYCSDYGHIWLDPDEDGNRQCECCAIYWLDGEDEPE